MKVHSVSIANFRGIRSAKLTLPKHAVLIGDNNTGKSSILEAIDLVLGPDRLGRRPPVDEHDFYGGRYLPEPSGPAGATGTSGNAEGTESRPATPKISIEVTVTDLSDMQKARFGPYVEWLDEAGDALFDAPDPAGVDAAGIKAALRVTFEGAYDGNEDDFVGSTFYTRSMENGDTPAVFTKRDKQNCGFLFLRTLRTGTRALSLEHGSLLDVILRLKDVRPQMWEGTIGKLAGFDVASDPALGISGILESVDESLKKYVPREWGMKPHLKVSNLSREHLRKVVTAFIATGAGDHAAPFFRQGTGTINMLVLAMLSQIAEGKQNVIFAMEEVETAIPPYAQKRIVHELRKLAAQSITTSHSPYVLEEYKLDETVILSRSDDGVLKHSTVALPESVKHKRYRQEFRTRFCEGLLSRRVLIAEGATEAASLPVAARRLAELNPDVYVSLEALGICVINAGTDSQIADLGSLYRSLGKRAFAVCDKQDAVAEAKIRKNVDLLLMHGEKGMEDLILKNTTAAALRRFAGIVDWPQHLESLYPDPKADAASALRDYFKHQKGNEAVADFLAQCQEDEMPQWIREACLRLRRECTPSGPTVTDGASPVG